MSGAERASKASRVEPANERAVRANKRTDERVAEYLRLDFWLFWLIVSGWDEEEEGNQSIMRAFINGGKQSVRVNPLSLCQNSLEENNNLYRNDVLNVHDIQIIFSQNDRHFEKACSW